jgi:hypothetical protein
MSWIPRESNDCPSDKMRPASQGSVQVFFDAVTVCRIMPHGIFCVVQPAAGKKRPEYCKWLIVNWNSKNPKKKPRRGGYEGSMGGYQL